MSSLTAKQRFTREWAGTVEEMIRSALDQHAVFSRLPEVDRMMAANCGAVQALLAIRSQSIEELEFMS